MTIEEILAHLEAEAAATCCPELERTLRAAGAEMTRLALLAGADFRATCTACRRRDVEVAGTCRPCYQAQRRQMRAFQRPGRIR